MLTIRTEIALRVIACWMGCLLLAPAWGQRDTLFTLERVEQVYPTSPDSALHMLDVMEKEGWEQPWFIEALRARVHFKTGHYFLAVECAKKAFALDSLRNHPVPYMETVSCCVKAFHQLNEWDDCLQLLNHGIGYARRHGNQEMEADLLYVMGKTFYHWGQRSDSYRALHDPLVRKLAVVGVILLILLLCVALFHLYRILQKNRQIAEQQKHSVKQEAQIALLEQQMEIQHTLEFPGSSVAVSDSLYPTDSRQTLDSQESLPIQESFDSRVSLDSQASLDSPEFPDSSQGAVSVQTSGPEDADYRLFVKLEKLMLEDRLFLRADLVRQDLLDLLAIDKNHFALLMQKYVKLTLPQYLTELRIRYALHQFREHPNFTVQAVADASGFANLRHFQRAFKQVIGMTPSEYKAQISD